MTPNPCGFGVFHCAGALYKCFDAESVALHFIGR